jgi:NADPH2:quinone reductase
MKALILAQFGAPYTLEDLVIPHVGSGEVLVKIAASGVNPLDLKIKAGQAEHARASLPAVLGIDLSGTIIAIGNGVHNFEIGDEVFGMTGGVAGIPGTLSEYAAVDARLIAKKPKNLNMHNSAALPLIFITAWEGLVDRAQVGPGKSVLIHGGAGGVGHIAIQIAKAKGAQVFTTVAPADNDLMVCYGATPIDYSVMAVDEYIDEFTHGEGFDIVFDTVGGTVLDASFAAAKQYVGHVVSIMGWGSHQLAPLSLKGATYSGVFTLYPLISGRGRGHHGEILSEASALVEAEKLIPNVDPMQFTLSTVEEAYHYLEEGANKGKVVIDMTK